jgi:hypothetical protein
MKQSVTQVLQYFSFFNYPPTIDEIYCFLKTKTSKGKLQAVLEKMEKKKVITSYVLSVRGYVEEKRYTLGEYGIRQSQSSSVKSQIHNSNLKNLNNRTMKQWNNETMEQFNNKYNISLTKLSNFRFRLYIKLLSLFPQIQLIGLSGTLAMMNADINDDIDLFIITARNRLFTGRIIAIVIGYLLFVKRERLNNVIARSPERSRRTTKQSPLMMRLPRPFGARNDNIFKDKVCLNLFFDESNLKIPKRKQTEYVAHEVLQMKPIINKNSAYERFLAANRWVEKIFPNVSQIFNSQFSVFNEFSNLKIKNLNLIENFKLKISNYLGDWIESLLKNLQLHFINRHRTTEIITSSQLWFFPDDFEKRIQDLH